MDGSRVVKVICMTLFSFLFFFISTTTIVIAEEPIVTAKSGILIEVSSGDVLWEKSAHDPMYPASTTKVLTAIMGIENSSLNEIVTISSKAASIGEASIYLEANQRVFLVDLIKGALIKSGNDAAYAIGEHIGGNEQVFLWLMNKKAALIGARNTVFYNTNGLPNAKHFSTAYDLALIGRYAMQNDIFSEIVKIKEERITFASGEIRYLKNTNKLLWNYPYASGIKTGTTRAAGECLVASSEKNGNQLITVVLNSHNRYLDAVRLFEYGFNNWNSYTLDGNSIMGTLNVKKGQKDAVNIVLPEDLVINHPVGSSVQIEKLFPSVIEAPVKAGEKVGTLNIYIDGVLSKSCSLIIQDSVARENFLSRIRDNKNLN
ncbi:MAG: D-alanyl-D-alanine carboxypeptidase family protein [Bacillota bacterium]